MITGSPELRLIYDDRAKEAKDKFSFLKDARAEGRAEGKAEGKAVGMLIGQIQLLQDLLNVSTPEEAALSTMSEPDLNEMVSDLKQRLGKRG